jgi:hypothetical protein
MSFILYFIHLGSTPHYNFNDISVLKRLPLAGESLEGAKLEWFTNSKYDQAYSENTDNSEDENNDDGGGGGGGGNKNGFIIGFSVSGSFLLVIAAGILMGIVRALHFFYLYGLKIPFEWIVKKYRNIVTKFKQ